MSPRPRPDFVRVRLSAAGLQFAGDTVLRIHTHRMRYAFQGSTPMEVLRFAEWPALQKEVNLAGEPLFELAEEK
jgi:hypothetical protein